MVINLGSQSRNYDVTAEVAEAYSNSTSWTDLADVYTPFTALSVTVECSGKTPILITLFPSSKSGSAGGEFFISGGAGGGNAQLRIYKDGATELMRITDIANGGGWHTPGVISVYDLTPAAGSHTYKVQGISTSGSYYYRIVTCKLLAVEL